MIPVEIRDSGMRRPMTRQRRGFLRRYWAWVSSCAYASMGSAFKADGPTAPTLRKRSVPHATMFRLQTANTQRQVTSGNSAKTRNSRPQSAVGTCCRPGARSRIAVRHRTDELVVTGYCVEIGGCG